MELDLAIAVAGLVVGGLVGLTGMGGGALMTPLLVLLFRVDPLAAVSSDLVAAVVMKPIGGGVHLRRGTVHRGIVGWLVLGSVPAAFGGVMLLDALGEGMDIDEVLGTILGAVLVTACLAMVVKSRLQRRQTRTTAVHEVVVRPVPTVLIGVLGGLVVGLSSVGSGSLMLVLLLAAYPRLTAKQLVGTDLVQAVPLVGAAAIGHALFGQVELGITTSLLLGAVPGVYLGARASARAAEDLIRPVLIVVLFASGLKLLDVPTGLVLAGAAAAAAGLLLDHRSAARRKHPLPRTATRPTV